GALSARRAMTSSRSRCSLRKLASRAFVASMSRSMTRATIAKSTLDGERGTRIGRTMEAASASAKTIGILTSGGDCAGLNAVIRAVACRAIDGYGWRVLGIRQGTMGLLRRPVEYEELGPAVFAGSMLRMGGTVLGTTNKGNPFAFPMPDGSIADRSEEVIAGYRELGLDALIGIGG